MNTMEISFDEDIFEIQYQPHRGYPQTFDEPGEPDSVEILEIHLFGEPITPNQQEAFIEKYGEQELCELCLDDAREQAEELRAECLTMRRRWAS